MPTFKYVAKNENAQTVSGKIVADNQAAVIEELRKRRLTIVSVNVLKERGSLFSFQSKKVKGDDIVIFSRQLATMVEAGIPILEALDALQEQAPHPHLKEVLTTVKEDIETGSSLSAAFAKHPDVFDSLFVNMIKVGETGGILSGILNRIAEYMEKSLRLKRKVKSAMVYPITVVCLAIAITLALLIKVVPTFKAIYDSMGQKLPMLTQILLSISEFLQRTIVWIIAGIFIIGVLINRYGKTETGRLNLDRLKLRLPIFGELLRKVYISRFSRTLATLVESGVPILASLDIVGKTAGNKVIELVTNDVRKNVREGESITSPLVRSGVFPPMVTRMIAVGEKTGEMGKMLSKVADFFDDQVDAAVSGLTSIIEPLIIGVLGVVIGFIVISLFLPIINLTKIIH